MKPDHPAKHFVIPFLIAVGVYVLAYGWIEHRRTRTGPWELTFGTNSSGNATVIINQPKLGLTNVTLAFAAAPTLTSTNQPLPIRMTFAQPKPVPYDLPFGKCIFMDTTFLPGTLTMSLFEHEIELLPRVLIIDHTEHPWHSGELIQLSQPQQKPN